MSRWSPTVTPTGVSVLGSAIRGGAEGWEAGREERRRKRRDELAEAMTLGQMHEVGISEDTRPRLTGIDRIRRDFGADSPMMRNIGAQAIADASGRPRPAPSEEEPELMPLGRTRFVLNRQGTPEARAESRRRAMRDELTGTLARAGFTPGEAELGGTVPETIGPTMTRQSAEARRQRIAGFVNAIPTQPGHEGHTALLAEVDPSGLRGELHPAEPRDYETPAERRARELELEEVRFGHEKVIAGIRVTGANDRPPLTLSQAVAIIYGYNVDEQNKPRWAPAEAHRLAQRLVAGTLRPEDLAPAPTPAAAPAEPGHFRRDVGRVGGAILRGSGATGPAPVTSGAPTPPAPRQPPQGRKTPVSQQDYDDAVADQGAAYAARHYIVVSR